MEIVAMEMKHRGMYIARQLSFKDVTFKVDEVALSPKFIKSYDDSVKLWVQLLQSFTEAAELVNADPKMRKTMWAQFWSAHQRFFKYLCIAAKVKHAVKVASEAVKCGKCMASVYNPLERREHSNRLRTMVNIRILCLPRKGFYKH